MVRLKVSLSKMSNVSNLSFNSKMVRLKAIQAFQLTYADCSFQFQNGAIKSGFIILAPECGGTVSIPKWCD